MLQSFLELMDGSITAADGEFGRITDILFDDIENSIRFVIVETAGWLSYRRLVMPYDAFRFAAQQDNLHIPYSRKEVLSRYVRAKLGVFAQPEG
jgi:hypothetical protein